LGEVIRVGGIARLGADPVSGRAQPRRSGGRAGFWGESAVRQAESLMKGESGSNRAGADSRTARETPRR
jgi:hypothetical protein